MCVYGRTRIQKPTQRLSRNGMVFRSEGPSRPRIKKPCSFRSVQSGLNSNHVRWIRNPGWNYSCKRLKKTPFVCNWGIYQYLLLRRPLTAIFKIYCIKSQWNGPRWIEQCTRFGEMHKCNRKHDRFKHLRSYSKVPQSQCKMHGYSC